jgi:hypothetical protein
LAEFTSGAGKSVRANSLIENGDRPRGTRLARAALSDPGGRNMIRVLARVSLITVVALLTACGGGGGKSSCEISTVLPTDDGTAPNTRLDLSHWILTVPVDSTGGTTGQADTIQASELLAGYSSDWFYGTDDGGVAFWAPVTGAKTPKSQYARSELREVLDPSDQSVNWSIADGGTMTASLTVSQTAAATRKVIVGKIVGYSTTEADLTALLHLIYFIHGDTCKASLYGLVSESPTKGAATQQLYVVTNALKLGEPFDYTIEVNAGTLTLRSGTNEVSAPIDPSWSSVPVYFRAGAGLNATGTSSSDGGSVTFYDLAVTH